MLNSEFVNMAFNILVFNFSCHTARRAAYPRSHVIIHAMRLEQTGSTTSCSMFRRIIITWHVMPRESVIILDKQLIIISYCCVII